MPDPTVAEPTKVPSLDQFLSDVQPLNPDASELDLAHAYHDRFPDAPKPAEMPSLPEFLKTVQPLNPGTPKQDLIDSWTARFGLFGAPKEDIGLGGTFMEGVKSTGRSLLATGQALVGDEPGVVATAQDNLNAPKAPALRDLLAEIEKNKEANPDRPWYEAGASVGKSFLTNPKGAGLLLTEQLPNTAAALGSAATGAALGSAVLPGVGTVVGGLLGLFGANVLLETGGKVLEAASDKTFTPDERDQALQQGLIKGSVISGVDALTFGATKWMMGTATRAMEHATATVLKKAGVDVADEAAVVAARSNPEIVKQVAEAQKSAYESATKITSRVARGGGEASLETMGEGVGEYLGELAATGKGDVTEAAIEALAGFGTSVGEMTAAGGISRAERLKLTPKTDPIEGVKTILDDNLTTVDQVIQKANEVTTGVPITPESIDTFIKQQQGSADTLIKENQDIAATNLTTQQIQAEKDADQQTLEATMGPEGLSKKSGGTFFQDAPLTIIHPTELPDSASNERALTKDRYEAISAVTQSLFGKRVAVYQEHPAFDGFVNKGLDDKTIFLSSQTTVDPFTVALHEAIHTLEKTPLHEALRQAVWENLSPNAKSIALRRHGKLPDGNLLNEVVADVSAQELQKPEVMAQVYARLAEKMGPDKASEETQSFLQTLKDMIVKVKALIVSQPWKNRQQKNLVASMVTDLTKVHDALAEAVADSAYRNRLKTKPAAGLQVVHPATREAFTKIAQAQRGAPTQAMLDIQRATKNGVISPAVEQASDLIRHMTEGAAKGESGKENLQGSIQRLLETLTHPYGFEKQHQEETKGDLAGPLKAYTEAHRALPVHNRPQWLARQVAIDVGEKRFDDAIQHLKELEKVVKDTGFDQEALSAKLVNDQPAPYQHPVKGSLVGKPESILAKTDAYSLEEDIPGHKKGETVSHEEIKKLGYRVAMSDVISGRKAKRIERGQPEPGKKKADVKVEEQKPEPKVQLSKAQTETPAFKQWFGESKVVNADGTPMVVYHGTSSDFPVFKHSNIGEFGEGMYFTTSPQDADGYTGTNTRDANAGKNIKPVYLSIQRPFVIRKNAPESFWNQFGGETDADAIRNAKDAGYDGLKFEHDQKEWVAHQGPVKTGRTQTHWIAFEPTQIKSATGNVGTFDRTNPDIRFSPAEPRTYDDVQKDIDTAETTLDQEGVNIAHLYDPSDTSTAVLHDYEDWKPMPETLAALYRERYTIESADKKSFLEKTIKDSKLPVEDATGVLKALYLDQDGLTAHFHEVLRDWSRDKTANLTKIYNYFAAKKYDDLELHYAKFIWGGTAEKPTVMGGTARGGQSLDQALLNKTEDIYNAIAKNIDAKPISLAKTKRLETQFSPVQATPPSWAVDPPGKLDYLIRRLQNKNIDIQRVVEAMQAHQLPVPEDLNPVLSEEMYQKRAEQQSKDFTNDELRPLLNAMRLNKVSIETLNEFLHARHVIDDQLNARLKAMNPTLANNDALSGISDAQANAILAKANLPVMDALARHVDDIVNTTRKLMVDYGLEKADRITEWKRQYQAYVPLRREGFEEGAHPTGTGRSVRGSTVKGRGGSTLAVDNILANIAQERDQIISRGEKQRPVIAMAGLLMLHPNPTIATIDKPAPIQMTDPATGLTVMVPGNLAKYQAPTIRRFDPVSKTMKTYPDPTYKGRDNVVNFRVKGVDYAIVFNEHDPRALEMAKAFKELDTAKLSGITAAVAPYTRYLAAVNTQYNPIFGIVNFVRDTQFAMLTLGSTPLHGHQAQVLKHTIGSLKGIYDDARAIRNGQQATSPTARLWQRFEHVGGPTGYRDLFFTSTDRAVELERLFDPSWKHALQTAGSELKSLHGTKAIQAIGKRVEDSYLFQMLSDYNLVMENSIRLGVFKTAVDLGMSDLQAASYAKNITVNFNKKGQVGAQMGALYAFFNANVQGTARIAETLFEKTPKGYRLSSVGKKIVAGGLLVGVLQTFLLAIAGFDDDDPPEFVKQKNFVIPLPFTNKKYTMLPMPLGFNLLPNVGRLAAEAIKNGVQGKPVHAFQKGASLFSSLYGTLSPTGGQGDIAQELSPTVADPLIAAFATNKDWTGKSISKEDISSLDPTPGTVRVHDTATPWARGLATMINWATGGTDYVPGVLSPTPDVIDYLIGQATGGVGREVSKAAQVGKSLYTGEELPAHKVPGLGRFYGSATGSSAVRAKFYATIKESNMAWNEVEGRAKDRLTFSEYLASHPEARLAKAGLETQKDVSELQKQKRYLMAHGASRELIRQQEDRITQTMSRFNTLAERLHR